MCPAGMVWVVSESAIVKSPAPSVAEAGLPVPPLVELTLPVVLSLEPEVVGVTLTLTAHELLAAIPPPLRLMEVLPAAAVNVPPQLSLALGTAATCRPVGKLSVTATPLKAVPVFGLVMVKVRVEVPPTAVMVNVRDVVPFRATVEEPNAFAIEGGPSTASVAVLLVPPAPVSFELTAPVVLLFSPTLVPVTFRPTLHDALAARLPPLRLKLVLPAVAPVTLPPQGLLALGTAATSNPLVRLSVHATPGK